MRVYRVLVIKEKAEGLYFGLREAGFEVFCTADLLEGEALALSERPDLTILDPFLPGPDGLTLLATLKCTTNSQVLVVTAPCSLDQLRACWQAGADDWQTGPISVRHLLARAQVRMRKVMGPLRVGRLVLDFDQHCATLGSQVLKLSGKEFLLLAEFMRTPGLFISYQDLYQKVWGRALASGNDLKTLQIQVGLLRQKLQEEASLSPPISGVWDEGYRLDGSIRPRPKILVLAPLETLRELEGFLGGGDYDLLLATDGAAGLSLARAEQPDLVILEPLLETLDGLSFCRILRRESSVSILLTSARGMEIDQMAGLEAGAGDYIVKPWDAQDFSARIQANLPSVYVTREAGTQLRAGALTLNLRARQAWVHHRELNLTRKEFRLLAEFARQPGVVLSRADLVQRLWSETDGLDDHTVEVHIATLRSKLDVSLFDQPRIATLPGHGYRLLVSTEKSPGVPVS